MDIIAGAIAGALGNLGAAAVLHNFSLLKEVLKRKYGAASKLYKALMELEKEPDSPGRKMILEEEIQRAEVGQDKEIQKAAEALLAAVKEQTGGVGMDIGSFKAAKLEVSDVVAEEKGTAVRMKDVAIEGTATFSKIGGSGPKR